MKINRVYIVKNLEFYNREKEKLKHILMKTKGEERVLENGFTTHSQLMFELKSISLTSTNNMFVSTSAKLNLTIDATNESADLELNDSQINVIQRV